MNSSRAAHLAHAEKIILDQQQAIKQLNPTEKALREEFLKELWAEEHGIEDVLT